MRVPLILLALLGFATSHALTFQFVSKSTRKIIVPTEYRAISTTTINQFYVVGTAGGDILLERIDKFGNQLAQAIYDGPGFGDETVLGVVTDNLNQPVVLYRDQTGTRLAKFEATLGNIYDIPVGSSDAPVQLHRGLAGTVIAIGSDPNGDMLAKKFATNGSVVWRTVVIENGSTSFIDGAVGPGEEVAIAGKNSTQGLIARLRGSDGARTATFVTAGDANASNRIETIAYAPDTNFLFGAGFFTVASTFARRSVRINTPDNAALVAAMTGSSGINYEISASIGITPRVAVVGERAGGMELVILSSNTLETGVGPDSNPNQPKVFHPTNGGIVAFGSSGQDPVAQGPFVRYDNAGLKTYTIPGFTSSDRLLDAVDFLSAGAIAVGTSQDVNNQEVGLLMAGNNFAQLLRYTEQRVHHPRRSIQDSATDSAGAHYTLTRMDGAIDAPFVVKHSSSGQQIWGAQLSFPNLPFLRPVAMGIGPNGHPVVVCIGKTTEDPDSGNWVLFQLNGPNGSVRWSKILAIGNPASGAPADLDVHSDNSIGVVGRVNFFGQDSNFAAARLTTTGTVQWTRIFQSLGPDRLEACRFRPTGELACIGLVGGSFPGRLQLLTFNVDGGFRHQSIIEEADGTTHPMGMDMEPSGNILVSYKVDVIPTLNPDRTVVRRIDPLTGTTLMSSTRDGAPASRVVARVSPDGFAWVVHKAVGGLIETYRVNPSTGVQTQALAMPATVLEFGDLVARSDNSAVVTGLENSGAGVTAVARRLPTGGQAALRRIAGIGRFIRNAPGGFVWVSGDVTARTRGTEQFAAKYSVP